MWLAKNQNQNNQAKTYRLNIFKNFNPGPEFSRTYLNQSLTQAQKRFFFTLQLIN